MTATFSKTTRSARAATGVVLQPTDRALLRFVGEHYAVRLDALRFANAIWGTGSVVSTRAVRTRVGRWAQSGLITVVHRHGRHYVTPTTAGYVYAGLDYNVWAASDVRIAHVDAVSALRLWYEWDRGRVAASGAWINERQLFRERGRASWHLHDAELATPDSSGRVGVEVELTLKTPSLPRYREILSSLAPHISGVMYLCAPDITDRVSKALTRCPSGVGVWVRNLPSLTESDTSLGPTR